MIKSKFIISTILISLFVATFFAFAQEGEKSPPNSVSPTVAAPAETQSAIQQLASISQKTDSAYNYSPVGKPDPFRPFVEIDTEAKKAPEKKEDKKDMSSIFPLQRIATEKFRVVGIAGDQMRRVAIVEDVTKKFYPLFKGTYIGLKNGRVVEIMGDRVIVEEREANTAKRIILKLRKD
jgi:Tfp pilus assembly protein PilP